MNIKTNTEFTSAKGEYVYDGDNVECTGCGLFGAISVEEDDDGIGRAKVDWNDYDED